MSALLIREALETALASITPALDTAWENVNYTATPGTPYQYADIILAEPLNPEMTGNFHTEIGIFQVTLMYPTNKGPADCITRAELIRAKFPRGAQFTSGSVRVTVDRTPAIGLGSIEGDRWAVPVKIRFYSNLN